MSSESARTPHVPRSPAGGGLAAPPAAVESRRDPAVTPSHSPATEAWICVTCGVQFAPASRPPACCPICEDERQFVGSGGQEWTTLAELRRGHRNEFTEEEPGLLSIQTRPGFAISQRALLVETPAGNVLWDCLSLVDDETIETLRSRGGVAAIAISHPHFYSSMLEWSRALGGAPIWVHENDRSWIQRPDEAVHTWSGATHSLPGGLTLVNTGGHFPGSQVLHWPSGAEGRGVLLVGDEPNICSDRRWVTFMRSYPNFIPLSGPEITRITEALRPLAFDRLYGWSPDRVLRADAKRSVALSAERHARALRGEHGVVER